MLPLGILSYSTGEIIGNFERTDPFSIEMWVCATGDKTNATLISHITALRGWTIFSHGSRGKLQQIDFGLYHILSENRLVVTNTTGLAIVNNTFFHLVITYDGSSLASGIKYYVNGSIKSLTTAASNLTGTIKNSAKLLIGSGPYPYFLGKLDECVVYNRVLSQAEVTQRYNSGVGTETLFGDAYLHCHMNELSGDDVLDSSGNNRNLKTYGTPSWTAGKLNNCVQLDGSTQYISA